MQYLTLAIASAFLFASRATAQMPDVPPCLMGCFNDVSATAGCSSSMDLQCMCTSDKFTQPAMTCVLTKCSSDDRDAASKLYTQYCVAFTGNSTTTATGTSAGHSTNVNLGLLLAGAGATLFAL